MGINIRNGRIDLTENLTGSSLSRVEWLQARMVEKDVGSYKLFGSMANPPEGLKFATIKSWLSGETKSASWEHWRAVKLAIRAYDAPLTIEPVTIGRVDMTERWHPQNQSRGEWLRARMIEKKVGAKALFNSISNPPEELTQFIMQRWFYGTAKTASWEHWRAVKLAIQAYDAPLTLSRVDLTEKLIENSPSRIDWLRAQMKEKRGGSWVLFNSIARPPEGLSRSMIQDWLNGEAQSATWEHWIAVKRAVRAYPGPAAHSGISDFSSP